MSFTLNLQLCLLTNYQSNTSQINTILKKKPVFLLYHKKLYCSGLLLKNFFLNLIETDVQNKQIFTHNVKI